jgi:lysophospholipase L1-like esterase
MFIFEVLKNVRIMIWYENEVKRVEQEKNRLLYPPKTIFYGSSSMRLWKTLYDDFKTLSPINLGFGGSTLAACVWFFNRIMDSLQPDQIIVYAGDNDLGDGRNPEEVYIFFEQLLVCMQRSFPNIPLTYISIKPSLRRKNIIDQIRYTNGLIKKTIESSDPNYHFINVFDKMIDSAGNPQPDLYDPDGLHLSGKGYALWKDIVLTHISSNVEGVLTQLQK